MKAISRYMQTHEITAFYELVERLCGEHQRSVAEVKMMLSTLGQKNCEEALRRGGAASPKLWGAAAGGLGGGRMPTTSPQRLAALRTLGFEDTADPPLSELQRRYRKLAKTWHPDKRQDAQAWEATERFKQIKNAVDYLSKPGAAERHLPSW